jgi:hypothetical protein
MEFMLLFIDRKDARSAPPAGMAALSQFAKELGAEGKLRRAAPLGPEAAGARIRVRDGKAFVLDGPFAESKEVVGGFWIVDVAGRDEAIGIARRAFELGEPRPHARSGVIEVHHAREPEVVADTGKGAAYLLAFHMEPGLTDPDGSKMAEMIAFTETLKQEGRFLETAPLAKDPAPARVQARRGRTVVTDGPFAETKDVVGGYSLVLAASRAEAIEIATRYPHAKWGPVEVRELL